MKVIIVGAGLGGLSAAVCFARRGHQVLVVEKRETLSPKGGGINIRAGASRIMHTWGLEADLAKISENTPSVLLRRMDTGDIATRNIAVDASEYPDWGTSRLEVIKLLYTKAMEEGAKLMLGSVVSDISEDDSGVLLTLSDGSSLQADIVLAADGIQSRLRPKILADLKGASDPIISRTTFYGIDVDSDELRKLPGTSRLTDQSSVNCWLGQGAFVVTRYNSKLGRVGMLFAIESDTDQRSLWDEKGDINYVRGQFTDDTCTELRIALSLATSCDRWKLAEVPNLPRWSSPGGRILLLGDSAHGMHPNAAQGFSLIVEDIAVLDHLLAAHEKRLPGLDLRGGHAKRIAESWEAIRKPRVERIKTYAKWNTEFFLGKGAIRVHRLEEQNVLSLAKVKPDMNASFSTSKFIKFLLDYDAVEEARKSVEDSFGPRL